MLSNKEKTIVGEIRFGIKTLVHNMNLTDEEADIVNRMNDKLDTLDNYNKVQYIKAFGEKLECYGYVVLVTIKGDKAFLFDDRNCKEYTRIIKNNRFSFRESKFDVSKISQEDDK